MRRWSTTAWRRSTPAAPRLGGGRPARRQASRSIDAPQRSRLRRRHLAAARQAGDCCLPRPPRSTASSAAILVGDSDRSSAPLQVALELLDREGFRGGARPQLSPPGRRDDRREAVQHRRPTPDRCLRHGLPRFVRQALAGEDLTVYGTGPSHAVSPMCSTLSTRWCCLRRRRRDRERLQRRRAAPVSVIELAGKVIERAGSDSKSSSCPTRRPTAPASRSSVAGFPTSRRCGSYRLEAVAHDRRDDRRRDRLRADEAASGAPARPGARRERPAGGQVTATGLAAPCCRLPGRQPGALAATPPRSGWRGGPASSTIRGVQGSRRSRRRTWVAGVLAGFLAGALVNVAVGGGRHSRRSSSGRRHVAGGTVDDRVVLGPRARVVAEVLWVMLLGRLGWSLFPGEAADLARDGALGGRHRQRVQPDGQPRRRRGTVAGARRPGSPCSRRTRGPSRWPRSLWRSAGPASAFSTSTSPGRHGSSSATAAACCSASSSRRSRWRSGG